MSSSRPAMSWPARARGEARPPVRIADLAEVRDTNAEQANIVRVNGVRGVYIRVLKQPSANTISVVDAVRPPCRTCAACRPSVQLSIRSISRPTSAPPSRR